MRPIIRVNGISKSYRLGARQQYATLREELVKAVKAPLDLVRGRKKPAPETLWALRDVSFEVYPGEVLGVIGRNGAGKSTLLKILSFITEPTSGSAELYGRVGSLLEVGTGFHPELTGRENIYLNGTILGMKKREIDRRFDEIVAFSEIERFLETPVKYYSSGMYTRLAFSVAAHLDPEILIVDEVLAVGDAQFQKKCLSKMENVSKRGRTVLFVSHNMSSVLQLTSRAVLLGNGRVVLDGPTREVVERYSQAGQTAETFFNVEHSPRKFQGSGAAKIASLRFPRAMPLFSADEDFEFEIKIRAVEDIPRLRASMTVFSSDGTPVGSCFSPEFLSLSAGESREARVALPCPYLAPGHYYCGIGIGKGDHTVGHVDFDVVLDTMQFEVAPEEGKEGTVSAWVPSWGLVRFQPLRASALVEDALPYV